MKILYGYRDLAKKLKDPVCAIGIFDGIHIGHKRVIHRVLGLRGTKKRDKVVITFDPHPQAILPSGNKPHRIMSLEHRLFIFEKMGLDAVIIIRFTDHIATMSPEDFVKNVLSGIGTKNVYVGNNFHFGKGKTGNIETFKKIGKECDITVKTVPPVKMGGRTASSTWLRKLIACGDIKKAEKLLRRPVSVLGTVVKGAERGKIFGVPTANIDPHHEVTPPPGVYAVKVEVKGVLYDGVMNIGYNPTFYGQNANKKREEPLLEVHIIGFKGELYGLDLETFFIKKLRREHKFKNEQVLKRQIEKDIKKAGKLLSAKKLTQRIKRYKYL